MSNIPDIREDWWIETRSQLRSYRKAMRAVLVSKSLKEAKDAVRPLIEAHAEAKPITSEADGTMTGLDRSKLPPGVALTWREFDEAMLLAENIAEEAIDTANPHQSKLAEALIVMASALAEITRER